ncbi:OsmC family protein [Antarcticibacterium sp. 1MA-6-2]|uniref:OsmC family protein n=1 Tax=Antarcticibacterium sp. 1MA-6-2 TaxID=2908210 RepID=UPI001F1FF306|nr:OsmC family protein [Antarcticibacterium sp. 1MA-6-2]UJH90956.1 OsmC family protein [Antarcticibacterium sp. 1MA-6-2]
MEAHKYLVNLVWTIDRKGEVSSPVLNQKIEVATPPEFPGGIPDIWSPEHLFTAAVSSCFMTTFLAIAANSNLVFTSLTCPAEGILDRKDGKYAMTDIFLKPVLTIPNEEDREKAEKVLIKAEKACLISNSISSEVHLQTEVLILENHTVIL